MMRASFSALVLLALLLLVETHDEEKCDKNDKECEQKNCVAKCAVVSPIVGGISIFLVPVVIVAVGFAAPGIIAGSAAAMLQAVLFGGAIPALGWFALLQSIGAAGLGVLAKFGIVTGTFASCVAGCEMFT